MIITCQECDTSFSLNEDLLKESGSKVRCSKCRHVFVAYPRSKTSEPEKTTESMSDTQTEPIRSISEGMAQRQSKSVPASNSADLAAAARQAASPVAAAAVGQEISDSQTVDAVDEELDDFNLDIDLDLDGQDESDFSDEVSELDDEDLDISEIEQMLDLDDVPEAGGSLEHLGLDFDIEAEANLDEGAEPAESAAEMNLEDLDLSAVEEMLESEDDSENSDSSGARIEELELDLDMQPETDDLEQTIETDGQLDVEDLDLSEVQEVLESEADFEVDSGSDAPLEEANIGLEMQPEADDLDQIVETDGQLDVEDLNLSDLEEIPEPEVASKIGEDTEAQIEELDLASDMELDIADDQVPDSAGAQAHDEEVATGIVSATGDEVSNEADELDLELDLISESDDAQPKDESMQETASQSLDLSDLDELLGPDAQTDSDALPDEQAEDLDLSDLEAMLDGGTTSAKEPSKAETGELTEKHLAPLDVDDDSASEELDLSDLENSLDLNDSESEPKTAANEGEDLELDLDISATQQSVDAEPVEDELDIELSEFDDIYETENERSAEVQESDDIDLEFEIEEPEAKTAAAQTETAADEFIEEEEQETVAVEEIEDSAVKAEIEDAESVQEDALENEAAEAASDEDTVLTKSSSKKRYLLIFLAIALLAAGGYGAYTYLTQNNIKIPFISDFFSQKVVDPGNLKMSTVDINSQFIDNAKSGKLFVITGKIRNNYDHARRFVQISGKLFSAGKVLVKTENVYAGNVLSDEELHNLDFTTMKSRLMNRSGDNGSNANIQPGRSLPFMIAFSNLPDNLEEFTLEIMGSSAL